MEIVKGLQNVAKQAAVKNPGNRTIRAEIKRLVNGMLKELSRRAAEPVDETGSPSGIPTLTNDEERACKVAVLFWRATNQETEVEKPNLPPISLKDLDEKSLNKLLREVG